MTKRILFSLFAGIVFGILLAAAPGAKAQTEKPCYGHCEHQLLRDGCVSYYAGCALHEDQYGNLDYVTCFYVNTCVIKYKNY